MLQGYPVPFRRPAISKNPTRIPLIYPWLFIFLVVLLGINVTTPIHAQNDHKKNVLVLNSYNYGYGWTDSIMKGIETVLPRQHYNLTIVYMDSKGHEEPAYFQKLYDLYKYRFASKKVDVIICSDDNAFNFLKKYKNELFAPQTPAVFCGVNFFQDADLKGRQDFTGVVENYDIAGTIEMIRSLQPKLKEILVISDRTVTGISNTLKARKAMAGQFPQQKYTVVDDVTMDDLLQILERAPAGTVALYLGFAIDKTGKSYAPLEQSLAMLSRRSPLPFYSVWEFTLESVVGGMITSGYYQGEMAARMAQRLLEGEKVAAIPVVKESPNKPMFNYQQMERFGISPSQLPPGSIIVNQPVSFFEEHKSVVLGTTAVLGGLFLVIIVLTITINKRQRAEEALIKNYSELQNTAQQLEQSREMLQLIIESIPVRVFWKDRDLRYLGCNTLFARDAGLNHPQQLLGQDDFAMGWRDQADLYREDDRQVMESRRPRMNIVEPQTTPTGAKIWLNTSKVPLQKPNGEVFGVLGVYEDITERKQAEDAVAAERQRFLSLLEAMPAYVGLLTPDYHVAFANRYFRERFGEPEGRRCYEYMFGRSEPCENCQAYRVLETERPEEFEWLGPDGRTYQICDQLVHDTDGSPLILEMGIDITERKQAESERLQFSKLESLGTLAGGIAHDFNNILMAILGNIGLAALDDKIGPRVKDRLTQAEAACLRAQSLSQQLLTFAKGGAPIKKLFSVAELLTESTAFSCVGSSVKCETAFPENLWWIEADPGQISQVFQNITINGIQAMPTGGTLKVWAENLTLGTSSDLPLSPGKYIKISVQDQGMGIPAEHLPRIFDPYFTTKQQGSGLGLASAYAIIKKHHGHIVVQSKPGGGTTFFIYLPAVEQPAAPQPAEDRELLVGTGNILVMDDEDIVRQVLGKLLARLGYAAEFARDGGEAIEMFLQAQGSGQAFAAVILDLTVPGGMGGKETMARLLEIDPRVKAVVSSGYSDDPIMAEFAKYGFSDVIAKPYRISELGKVLHNVIMNKA